MAKHNIIVVPRLERHSAMPVEWRILYHKCLEAFPEGEFEEEAEKIAVAAANNLFKEEAKRLNAEADWINSFAGGCE